MQWYRTRRPLPFSWRKSSMGHFRALTHNRFNLRNPSTVNFYVEKLGLKVLTREQIGQSKEVVTVGYEECDLQTQKSAALRFSCADAWKDCTNGPDRPQGYWKIGISLPDVRTAVERLRTNAVQVGDPEQFLDIGYLCHLRDTEGQCIELLQHTFESNFRGVDVCESSPLGAKSSVVGQITFRVKEPQRSIEFYSGLLGMRLLSRQRVEPYNFTLYFLAFTTDQPPTDDLDAFGNREWLWQRPYTTIELQHRHGTEATETFSYSTPGEEEFGWQGITVSCDDVREAVAFLEANGVEVLRKPSQNVVKDRLSALVLDPDGYRVELQEISKDQGPE